MSDSIAYHANRLAGAMVREGTSLETAIAAIGTAITEQLALAEQRREARAERLQEPATWKQVAALKHHGVVPAKGEKFTQADFESIMGAASHLSCPEQCSFGRQERAKLGQVLVPSAL